MRKRKQGPRLGLVVSCLIVLLDVATGSGTAESGQIEGEALAEAAALFEEQCAICHEAEGNADVPRLNLVDEQWLHGDRLEDIERTIRDGIPETLMKPQAEKLSAEEISTLAQYVKLLSEARAPQVESGASASPEVPAERSPAQAEPPAAGPELSGLVSLRLWPRSPTLWGPGATQRFVVLGEYEDGLERDLTLHARFTPTDPDISTLDGEGRLSALADGELELKAEVGGLTALSQVRIEGTRERPPFNFQRQIGGVLTREGCNAAECHGGVKGRGGLKLAINAIHPEDDYGWIVKGGTYQVLTDEVEGERIPRVNIEEPEESLLLLKATYGADHEGGRVFSENSPAYRRLLDWARDGAPFDEQGAEKLAIERLEVFPKDAVLKLDDERQMVVIAHLANGRTEGVTDQVHFESNNKEVLKVSESGRVTAVGRGETDVIIRAAGRDATARFGVIEELIADYPDVPRRNLIDEHVFAKLRKFHILPSELSSDEEFLRRICLDVAGRLPPPARVREFLADPDPKKRDKLIETLLDSPEYVEYWTFRFADIFRVGDGNRGLAIASYWEWVHDGIANNKPYDQMARERLGATGFDGPSRHYSLYAKITPIEAIVAEELRVFMGRRLDCAQCHNHPFESWSQNQFWQTAAFYGGMYATEWSEGIESVIFDDPDWRIDHPMFVESAKVKHPRTKKAVTPAFLDGTPLPVQRRADPRAELAAWITSHPYFTEAIVNRMWSYFFGRGIVDPVDDFRSTNPPSHPALLDALACDFEAHGYDLKHLIRKIVRSRTYQLSHAPNASNGVDTINYSHAIPRPLDAEVLLDAICDVTGVPEIFTGEESSKAPPGTRAVQLKSPGWPSRFLEIYGRSLRQSLPERDGKPKLAQALHVWVGSTYIEKLSNEGGKLGQLIESGASDREVIEELYLTAFSRFPSDAEMGVLEVKIAAYPSRVEAYQNLLWAIMSSREFAYKP